VKMEIIMRSALLLVIAVASATGMSRGQSHYWQRLINRVNNDPSATWQAGMNENIMGLHVNVQRGLSGVQLAQHALTLESAPVAESQYANVYVPDSFDSREKWGKKCPGLYNVRDQSACGSCWAFGAVEAMSDRLCIASEGKIQATLSADDLLACCSSCGMGCDGGQPIEAWRYWAETGIVTGSNETAKQGCRPYPFPPCEHHSNKTHFPACHSQLYPTPKCEHKCQASYKKDYESDKYFGVNAYMVASDEEAIQREILLHGPVEAAFMVYSDFLAYKSGVYKHVTGDLHGGHAVKCIGWGVENGNKYWLVANSWNQDWGLDGLFKIARGNDECGFESQMVGGLPRTYTESDIDY